MAAGITQSQKKRRIDIILLNRLSSYGIAFRERDTAFSAFPRSKDFTGLSHADFRRLGFSRNNVRAIIELSEVVLKRNLEIESFEEMTDAEIVQYLLKIRGDGSWSAEYLLLRSLGSLIYFLAMTPAHGETSQNMWVLRKGLTEIKLKDHLTVPALCPAMFIPIFLSTN